MLAILFDKFLPGIAGNETLLYTAYPNAAGGFEIPFLIQMGWVFFFTIMLIVTVSLLDKKGLDKGHEMESATELYGLTSGQWVMVITILLAVAVLYARFW